MTTIDTKALRMKILDLAMSGKLVPQDPNDEPVEVLLDRIKKERDILLKQKKIKPVPDSVIYKGDDNRYYEKVGEAEDFVDAPRHIPCTWRYIHQQHVCWLENGEESNAGVLPYLEAKVIRGTKKATNLSNGIFVPKNEKVILVDGENSGEVMTVPFDGYMGSTFKILSVSAEIDFAFLLYYFELNREKYRNNKKGSAIPHLNKDLFKNILFPLPPIAEQHRVVSVLNKIMAEIDNIETQQIELSTITDRIKEKILSLAIQGKLVKQCETDEPASILLDKIRAEKRAVLGKKYIDSYIYRGDDNCYYEKLGSEIKNITEEIPFDIPTSWQWIRLGTLFQHNTGKALNSINTIGEKKTYITTSNLYWDKFILDNLKEMYFTQSELVKCTVNKGDLLVCEGGDIGRAAIWNFDFPMRIQNHIHRLRPYFKINIRFYYYVFLLYKTIGIIDGKGIAIQGLSSNALDSILIPLPSINIQNRTVCALEKLIDILKDED